MQACQPSFSDHTTTIHPNVKQESNWSFGNYAVDVFLRYQTNPVQAMGIHRLPHGGQQPFYHVLVDERDRPGTHTTYVAQARGVSYRISWCFAILERLLSFAAVVAVRITFPVLLASRKTS